ncbi:MAG: cytochrome-c oxidase, cbb3-type subunit III [Alphaproteobacteria bacterium]|nr:cytochrome-c oxidase, cbb3-type subunit III [Alphaproteobacteria bacterium]
MTEQDNKHKIEVDKLSGVETTGHEWDGLKELNHPLPRWWLWILYVSIIWSIGYWIVYPSWPIPGGATKGTSGETQFTALKRSQNEIFLRQQVYLNKFEGASFEAIMNDPELYAFAMAGGRAMFKDNCATCHGTGASGGKGYPNLNDDDWLWGGSLEEIHATLLHGIRSGDEDAHVSQMPAFGKEKLLTSIEVNTLTDYVLAMSSRDQEKPAMDTLAGHKLFQTNCASCHASNGQGDREFGAPNLTDGIWLYGGERGDVYETIYNSRAGVMPAWKDRLDENTLRQLAVYVHQLGGGEETREKPILIAVPQENDEKDTTPVDGEEERKPQGTDNE